MEMVEQPKLKRRKLKPKPPAIRKNRKQRRFEAAMMRKGLVEDPENPGTWMQP